MSSASCQLLYITTPHIDDAVRIGRHLVVARLVACANVLPQMQSIYWWDGAVQEANEAVLIVKTRESLTERVIDEVKRLHSYECPCIVALPITAGNPSFLEWIATETRLEP